MLVFKITGAILSAMFCSLMGISFQNDMKLRILLLQDFHRGVLLLQQEIVCLKFPLEEAMIRTGHALQGTAAVFFEEVGKRLEELEETSFGIVWNSMRERYLMDTALKQTDQELIRELGQQLGGMEPGGTDRLLKVYEQRLEMALMEAREEYREKAQLYKRLGIMGGIFLVILFL